jgi:hypothetical protein
MKIFGRPQLESQDLGGTVQFVLTQNYGLVGNLFGPLLVGSFAVYSWRERSVLAMIAAAAGTVGLFINWLQGRETILRVDPMEIVARGNLGKWFTTEIVIPRSEITSIGWSAGGEGDSGGLYVATGWRRPYLLPGATEEQGRAILDTIARRFPEYPIDERQRGSFLFGDDSGITTLGLNDPDARSRNSEP